MPKPPKRAGGKAQATAAIKDPRFSNFETDPRFRPQSKKAGKVVLDDRFKRMLKDDAFVATTRVDRYGRRLRDDSKKKALERLYRTEEEEEEEKEKKGDEQVDDDDVVLRELADADKKAHDPARGGGFSSSSEDDSDSELEDGHATKDPDVARRADMQRFHDEQTGVATGEVTARIAIVNLDWDNVRSVDLMALFSSFCPVGGRVERVAVFPSEFGKERMAAEEVSGPPKSLFRKAKEQRERDSDGSDDSDDSDLSDDEEDEEPDDDDDDDESHGDESDDLVKKSLLQEGDADDFDHEALRAYQLDRLRYYYAVIWCSDKATAEAIYTATDSSELLSSSNFLDLRFIPDDVSFDDEPRDSCDKPPGAGYKPAQFTTSSLSHSKVKLTWDTDPGEAARKDHLQGAFTGSRKEIAENDLKAYLASDSESEEEDDRLGEQAQGGDEEDKGPDVSERKLSKKEQARKRMRQALGLSDQPVSESKEPKPDGPVGDMQVTFLPVFSAKEGGASDKAPEAEETTIEKYKRKERERKAKRIERAVAKHEGWDPEAAPAATGIPDDANGEDLGFDDPFFITDPTGAKPISKSAQRKEERRRKRAEREVEGAEKAEQKAQLELLMADDNGGDDAAEHLDHFDMKQIAKAEKKKKKKKKGEKGGKGEAGGEEADLQEGFAMDLADDRFRAVFEDHEFAIDPSNPKFKATAGMKQLLEETRKKRKSKRAKGGEGEDEDDTSARREVKRAKREKGVGKGDDPHSLVEAVKRKFKR